MVARIERFWKIECTEGMNMIFTANIPITHLRDAHVEPLIRQLLAKYALSDTEIVEAHLTIPFKKKSDMITVTKQRERLGDKLINVYYAHASSISVTATLIQR